MAFFRLLSLKTQPPEEDRAGRVVCCCSGSWRLNDSPKVPRKFCKGKWERRGGYLSPSFLAAYFTQALAFGFSSLCLGYSLA